MNLVLAIEPDSSQADPLSSIIRTKLGADLVVVTSGYAAIVAMNQRVPDLVLFGRAVSQDQRTKIVTHLRSLTGAQVLALDIPQLTGGAPPGRSGFQNPFRKRDTAAGGDLASFTKQIGIALAKAEATRGKPPAAAAASSIPAVDETWNEVPLEGGNVSEPQPAQLVPAPRVVEAARPETPSAEAESDIRSAELSLIEAEVEHRLKSELERVRTEAAAEQARELARVEVLGAKQRAQELARIEREAAAQREVAIAEARAAAEAAAREAMAAEVGKIRSQAEQQLASEMARIRTETEQAMAAQLGHTRAQSEQERQAHVASAKADAEAQAAREIEEQVARVKAQTDARLEAEVARVRAEGEAALARAREEAERVRAEAERVRALEAEVARVKAETDARLQEEIERTRAETEVEVARAAAETAARLEAELARVKAESEAELARAREEAERARLAHQQATRDTDNVREVAARELRAAAEEAALRSFEEQTERLQAKAGAELAAETERIRAEGEKRLEEEVKRLRTEAERRQQLDEARTRATEAAAAAMEVLTRPREIAWKPVLAAAAVLVVVVGIFMLRSTISSAAKTSTAWAGTATKAATEAAGKAKSAAVAAAPTVKRALATAERAARTGETAITGGATTPAPAVAPVTSESEPAGPGFLAAFSRIPMDIYADGKRIGNTDDARQLLLSSGNHRIEFASERFHYRSALTVTIRPGVTSSHTVALPSGQVRVTTTPGAEVWVEGERVGVAPMDAIPIPIGTREVVVKDPSFGERRESVEVKYGETAELTLMPGVPNTEPQETPRLAPLNQYQPK